MIEEQVRVIAVKDGQLLLEAQTRSACGGCAAKKGCGTAVLSNVVGKKFSRFQVKNSIGAQVGDVIVVGLEEKALLSGSLVMYLLPVIGMIIMALLADTLLGGESGILINRDLDIALASLSGFAAGAGFARWYFRYSARSSDFSPVILRKLVI